MEESRDRGQEHGPGAFTMFLLAGASFGFFDVAAARAHSALLPVDCVPLFLTPLVLFGMVGAAAAIVERLTRTQTERVRRALLSLFAVGACLAPVLLQGARGCVRGCGFTTPQWVLRFLPALFLTALVVGLRRFAMRGRSSFFAMIFAATGLSTLAFEERFDVASAISWPFISTFTLLGVLAGVAAFWLSRRFRPDFVPVLGLAVAAATVGASSEPPSIPPRMRFATPETKATAVADPATPNILLIVLDAVRADRLPPTASRSTHTPTLDGLARSSYVFSHAIASSNYSLPSHASLLTGLLPSEHGAHPALRGSARSRSHAALIGSIVSQTQQLRTLGVSTLGVSSNYVFLARWTGLQRGFMSFDDRPKRVFRSSPMAPIVLSLLADWIGPPFEPLLPYRSAEEVREVLQAELEQERAPFFAFVNLMDAHEPRTPRTARALGGLDAARVLSYNDGVEYIDHELGELFAWMDARGLLRSTYVVVTSDHGEFLGEGGLWGHDVGLSETMLHVPLLIRPPGGLAAPVNIDTPFGLFRVLPIIRAGDAGFKNLGGSLTEPTILAEAWSYPGGGSTAGLPDQRAVFMGDLKLIAGRDGERQLFDLKKDPQELHDVWSALSPDLSSEFDAVARTPVRAIRNDRAAPPPDPEALERMRSLGYIRPHP